MAPKAKAKPPMGEGQTVPVKSAWVAAHPWLQDRGFDEAEHRFKAWCSICEAIIDSKLDNVKKHGSSKKHGENVTAKASKDEAKARGLSYFGADANAKRLADQVKQYRLKFDGSTTRQMTWLLSLLSRGDSVLTYKHIESLDRHLMDSVLSEVQVCLAVVGQKYLQESD